MNQAVLAALLSALLLPLRAAAAAEATNAPAPPLAHTAPPVPPTALPTPPKSPVALFRELLHLSPAERTQLLADRSPENRKLILAKVREYLAMSESARELRLKVTELHWYLSPLMRLAPAQRLELLKRIPEEDRPLVLDRLAEWDKLPAQVRQELLDNEATLRYFTEVQGPNTAPLSPERQRMLQAGIDKWNHMPEEQREKLQSRFKQFFDLRPEEKEKVLGTLSEPERRQLEKTLHAFGNLTPAQRAQCIRSFEKFTRLSLAERQQFLKNADRWKLMTPEQRQEWRELVNKAPLLPMPLANKELRPAPPMPPMPPLPAVSRPARPVVTNGN